SVRSDGRIGVNDTSYSNIFNVYGDLGAAGYLAKFHHDGNNINRHGLLVWAGHDNATTVGEQTFYFTAADGNGDVIGYIAETAGNFALTDPSDSRLKTNIVDYDSNASGIVGSLRVVKYNKNTHPTADKITGFIAQEVLAVYPDAVNVGPTG